MITLKTYSLQMLQTGEHFVIRMNPKHMELYISKYVATLNHAIITLSCAKAATNASHTILMYVFPAII